MLKGTHSCRDNWRVNDIDEKIQLKKITPLLENRKPIIVDHKEICWKFEKNPAIRRDTSWDRYKNANVMVPGILVEGPNPCNLKYRLVDGNHRMCKLKLETNFTKSQFYILTLEEFYSFLEPL